MTTMIELKDRRRDVSCLSFERKNSRDTWRDEKIEDSIRERKGKTNYTPRSQYLVLDVNKKAGQRETWRSILAMPCSYTRSLLCRSIEGKE